MNLLFPIEPNYPAGFTYTPDFISLAEEQQLLSVVAKMELHVFRFQGYEAKRKVASFGQDWSFEHQRLSNGKQIPKEFQWLIDKVAIQVHLLSSQDFAELLVTEYPAGSLINWHRDAPPFDLIAGISLQEDCIFRLRPYDKSKQEKGAVITFPVRSRSLYVMRGPARTDWQHSITPVTKTRYSITLRTLRK